MNETVNAAGDPTGPDDDFEWPMIKLALENIIQGYLVFQGKSLPDMFGPPLIQGLTHARQLHAYAEQKCETASRIIVPGPRQIVRPS